MPPATAKPKVAKYDPKAKYVARKRIIHPEAVNPDGVIDPKRESDRGVTFTMKHRADTPWDIEKLVDEVEAIELVKAV